MPSMHLAGDLRSSNSPMAPPPNGRTTSVLCESVAFRIRSRPPARATMPHPAPPICSGPMDMSPRGSAIPHETLWRRRWRAPREEIEGLMALSTRSNFENPDDAFRAIVEAHRGLSVEESADLDAALVLILANHIGDLDVLREAIALARRRMLESRQQQQQQQQ